MLSPEQIEIQRKKYESKHPTPKWMTYSEDHNNYLLNKNWRNADEFTYNEYRANWVGWLSCTESNNEIELPGTFLQFDAVKAVYVSDLIIALERQGFKVKA